MHMQVVKRIEFSLNINSFFVHGEFDCQMILLTNMVNLP